MLLFQDLKVGPTLTPGDQKQFHLCAPGGLQAVKTESEPLCSRGRCPPPRTQMKECCLIYLINFSLNSKSLTYIFLLLIKKGQFKTEFKTVC